MNIKNVIKVEKEAIEVLKRVKAVKEKYKTDKDYMFFGCKETASLKRKSMDLTRTLSELRNN